MALAVGCETCRRVGQGPDCFSTVAQTSSSKWFSGTVAWNFNPPGRITNVAKEQKKQRWTFKDLHKTTEQSISSAPPPFVCRTVTSGGFRFNRMPTFSNSWPLTKNRSTVELKHRSSGITKQANQKLSETVSLWSISSASCPLSASPFAHHPSWDLRP